MMVLVLLIAPIWIYPIFIMKVMCFALFACALNLLIGFGGLLSFGHAMFFGSGAYVFGLLMQKTQASIPVAILGAIAFSGILGLLIGAICVRLKEIYFSFLTLAFQMLIHSVILTWTSLTGGDQGLMGGIPRPPFLGINLSDHTTLYWFACALGVLCLLLMRIILQSPFGATLRMVRDSSERAAFLGIDVWRIKLYAFILSSCMASIGGVLMALFVSGAFPDFGYWTMSGDAIFMIMMGGLHVFIGPVVGAALLLLFNDIITRTTEYHGLALGLVVLLFALGFKRGITDFFLEVFQKINRKGGKT